MKSKLAILVVSCDKYSDLWPPFFKLFRIFWPDCIYPIYLGSNNTIYPDDSIHMITIGDDSSWADNLKLMLDQVKEEYVLMLLEDFFLEKKVEGKYIEELFEYVKHNNVDCLRLAPTPPPSKTIDKKLGVGKIEYNAPYCISTQPAIWNKDKLESLLHEGYTAWDFEKRNSVDAANSGLKLCGTKKFYIKRHNGVERGKYYASTLKLLNANGIYVDEKLRGVINDLTITKRIYTVLYKVVQFMRVKIKMSWVSDKNIR